MDILACKNYSSCDNNILMTSLVSGLVHNLLYGSLPVLTSHSLIVPGSLPCTEDHYFILWLPCKHDIACYVSGCPTESADLIM